MRMIPLVALVLSLSLVGCSGGKDIELQLTEQETRLDVMDEAVKNNQFAIKQIETELDMMSAIVEDMTEIVMKMEEERKALSTPPAETGSGHITKIRAGFYDDKTRIVLDFSKGAKIAYKASTESDDVMRIELFGSEWRASPQWTAKKDASLVKSVKAENLADRSVLRIHTAGGKLAVKIFKLSGPRLVLDFSQDK